MGRPKKNQSDGFNSFEGMESTISSLQNNLPIKEPARSWLKKGLVNFYINAAKGEPAKSNSLDRWLGLHSAGAHASPYEISTQGRINRILCVGMAAIIGKAKHIGIKSFRTAAARRVINFEGYSGSLPSERELVKLYGLWSKRQDMERFFENNPEVNSTLFALSERHIVDN